MRSLFVFRRLKFGSRSFVTLTSGHSSIANLQENRLPHDEKAFFEVTNPSDGKALGSVHDMTVKDAEFAVQKAYDAFQHWRETTAKERSEILRKWYDLMKQNSDDLAALITAENGKSLSDARAELLYGSGFVEWYAEEAKRTYGDTIPSATKSKRVVIIKQPIGVAAMITPWNFPHAMVTRKAAPALAAGCTVVLKAAEDTPYSALALGQLAQEAGFPDGVFNVLTCSRTNAPAMGKFLCEHPLISHLSFTGSTATGKAASTVKKVALELGGNAPFIVFNKADMNAAVRGAIIAKFRCSGQTCVCVNRFLIQEDIYDEFLSAFKNAIVSELKVGDGMEEDVNQGPLINKQALQKVAELVTDAVEKGAEIVVGGKKHALGGLFYEPTLIKDVTPQMKCSKNEIFGPVAAVQKFSTEEEAIRLANDTMYGLAAYIYTDSVSQCWRVAEKLEYGMVGMNEGLLPSAEVPMGGVKHSGLGREGSKYGIEEFLELKYMCLGSIA